MPNTPALQITVYAQTDVGRVRPGNEDNFIIVNLESGECWSPAENHRTPDAEITLANGPAGVFVAVSDGMGGALAGEVASTMAVTLVRNLMMSFRTKEGFSPLPFSERFRAAIEETNLIIHRESLAHQEYAGMGATFTGAGLEGETLYLGQIGDSRAYLIRGGFITQVTKDQSLVGSLIDAGHLTEEEAETHAYRNVILQALGATTHVNVDVRSLTVHHNDVILMCSDGLSGKVHAAEMLEIVTESASLIDACESLIQLANEHGGDDNITVALLQMNAPELDFENGDEGLPVVHTVQRDPNIPDGSDDDTDEIPAEERPPGEQTTQSLAEEIPDYQPPRPRQLQIDPQPSLTDKPAPLLLQGSEWRSRMMGVLLILSVFLMLAGLAIFRLTGK